MNMVIDAGNSLYKTALFNDRALLGKETFPSLDGLQGYLQRTSCTHLLISSVSESPDLLLSWSIATGRKLVMSPRLRLPLQVNYETPETLGVDRLAAACGAWSLYPRENSLAIDAGTCINYELVRAEGTYEGGAISPGLRMRFESMHRQTAKLPLASAVVDATLTGKSTISSLQSGVMNGALEEIRGVIARYKNQYPSLRVVLCGGDAHFFENHLKPSIFVAPDLVLTGLNTILLYNGDT